MTSIKSTSRRTIPLGRLIRLLPCQRRRSLK
ncbi:hypothetical protein OESDEN_16085 [Oesophagostomum dentatum]|uniref:Uncharacterized protein n=1 Tax=Oesophagostomum dentatum TaxID=61180 RepID=A0A0B1SH16_OESDE|nr:hypothetical protein OESDEN_16085 [Oesophagostomum dentatum]